MEKASDQHKQLEQYLIRHCARPNGVILVDAGETFGIFTSYELAIEFAKSCGSTCEFTPQMLDNPDFFSAPSKAVH